MPKRATLIILTNQAQEALLQVTKRHWSEQQQVCAHSASMRYGGEFDQPVQSCFCAHLASFW
jgi:hypothetical protein